MHFLSFSDLQGVNIRPCRQIPSLEGGQSPHANALAKAKITAMRQTQVYLYRTHMRRSRFYIALFLVLPSFILAQWKEVGPNVLSPFTPGYGALHYADGTLWVGNNELWSSPDTGKTWVKSSYKGKQIRDIHFLDRYIGLVASEFDGVQLTRDGGKTWKMILDCEAWEVSFNGSPDIIHVLGTAPATIYSTIDGGANWTFQHLGTYGMSFAIARDNRIYTFAGERYQTSSRGWTNYSTDFGVTWSNNGATIDGDSYTLSVDSCDNRRLYLVNEDYASSNDGVSQLFVSTNGGLTWTEALADSGIFLSGSLATTAHTLYAGTVLGSGIYRSTDKGITWAAHGGPAIGYDARGIFAISDNLVAALGVIGSVWITRNSGGDSLTIANDIDTIAGATTLSEPKASLQPGDTVHVNIRVKFPVGSAINAITPQEITYTIHFGSSVAGIIPADDIGKSIIAPTGWVFKQGQLAGGKLTVTLSNVAKAPLQFEQDFGRVVFTAIAAPSQQTNVLAGQLQVFASCNAYTSFFGIEVGHIRTIVVKPQGVDRLDDDLLSVYPNPATHILHIESGSDLGRAYVELYDELGKLQYAALSMPGKSTTNIDVRAFPNGVYYLRIETAQGTTTRRVMVNK